MFADGSLTVRITPGPTPAIDRRPKKTTESAPESSTRVSSKSGCRGEVGP